MTPRKGGKKKAPPKEAIGKVSVSGSGCNSPTIEKLGKGLTRNKPDGGSSMRGKNPKAIDRSRNSVNINKQKKDALQILKHELDVDPDKNSHFDARIGIDKNKLLRLKKNTFQFFDEGKWSKEAEIIKLKTQFGEAKAKELKAKQAQTAKAKAELE